MKNAEKISVLENQVKGLRDRLKETMLKNKQLQQAAREVNKVYEATLIALVMATCEEQEDGSYHVDMPKPSVAELLKQYRLSAKLAGDTFEFTVEKEKE